MCCQEKLYRSTMILHENIKILIFAFKGFEWTKISVFDWKTRNCRNKIFKWSKSIQILWMILMRILMITTQQEIKRESQNIVINHSVGIDYKDFMNIYKKCTSEPYSFWLLILYYARITILHDPLRFSKFF